MRAYLIICIYGYDDGHGMDLQIIQKQKIWKTYVIPVFGSQTEKSNMEIPVYGAPRVASLASEMGLLRVLIIIKKGSVC